MRLSSVLVLVVSSLVLVVSSLTTLAQGPSVTETKLTASDAAAFDFFGGRLATHSVAVSGNTIVVGADSHDDAGPNSGVAYVFQRLRGAWIEVAKLTASDGAAGDRFGFTAAASGRTIVVGAPGNDDNGPFSGAAYVFQ